MIVLWSVKIIYIQMNQRACDRQCARWHGMRYRFDQLIATVRSRRCLGNLRLRNCFEIKLLAKCRFKFVSALDDSPCSASHMQELVMHRRRRAPQLILMDFI